MSSISPIVAKKVSKIAAAKGVEMIDAPVSGGEPKAIDGTLSIMAGGKENVFEENKFKRPQYTEANDMKIIEKINEQYMIFTHILMRRPI